jgi:hypothetical protein
MFPSYQVKLKLKFKKINIRRRLRIAYRIWENAYRRIVYFPSLNHFLLFSVLFTMDAAFNANKKHKSEVSYNYTGQEKKVLSTTLKSIFHQKRSVK